MHRECADTRSVSIQIRKASEVSAVVAVRNLLSQADDQFDFAHAAAAVDGIVDVASDTKATFAQLNLLTEAARHLARPDPSEDRTLSAIRTVLHRPGAWNGGRPFYYDHADSRNPDLKRISNYLRTRRGNCVSMPILFLILANRLGLDIGLALAPSHLFLRLRRSSGHEINLEAIARATLSQWRIRDRPAFIW
jgi:regulator of sirC expression with transglutaminase-like and TPR domain